MRGVAVRTLLIASVIVFGAASAQAQTGGIAGVAKDASGAVLPGVTVEASSPVLIEKVRSTVTDGNGQYRLVSLPAGSYTVRFSLVGFNSVSRAVDLATGFNATIDPELRVGSVEETITVTAESPVVDVENARQIRVVEADVLKSLPSGRSPSQLLSMIPGMNGGSGVCSGGTCGPTLNAFSAHGGNTAEGRLQVDGMGAGAAIGGAGVSGYLVDIANAQEMFVSLTGGMGEAEVGGPVINVIPRAGGNRVSGSYFTSYTNKSLWDVNNETHTNINVVNNREWDYDVNGSFGGPVRRDRLWYFLTARRQSALSNVPNAFRNLNEGVYGASYSPDRTDLQQSENTSKNVALRMTLQASRRNRFTFFWDEQSWCTTCNGTGTAATSPEAANTAAVGPNRVHQATWTNPWTSRLLLEGRFSTLNQKWGIWPSFTETWYRDIPRITETGVGAHNGNITSGSMTNWDADTSNTNIHMSTTYVTGGHSLKVGYQAVLMHEWTTMDVNNLRLHYAYVGTAASGVPIPSTVTMWARPRTTDERSRYNAAYVQDAWTINRLTLQGALRFDHAWSYFPEQTTGPGRFMPAAYSFPKTDGVNFNDVSPRIAAAWDVFGTGKTAVKAHYGRYLQPTQVGGVFNATNPMRRSAESITRGWTDGNNNRIVDCNLTDFTQHTLNGDTCFAVAGGAQFGLDPRLTGVGFTTTYCGRTDAGISPEVLAYCDAADQNLINGWGKREFDWQVSVGVQQEVLPRVSAEVTYNRRWYGNFYLTDNLSLGCNLDETCMAGNSRFVNPDYDFLSIRTPVDARLPGGGGNVIDGFTDIKPAAATRATLNAITLTNDQYRYWHGVDTSLTWRARGGLNLTAGTSTGRQVQDTCNDLIDNPVVGSRPFSDCHTAAPFQTNVRGTFAYTIPRVDVLVSGVFQHRPGTSLQANYTVTCSAAAGCADIVWAAGATPGRGQTVFLSSGTTKTVNLVPNQTMYGEGHNQIDLKVAKVFRFGRTRANVGMDIYNALNTDAITSYNQTYSPNAAGGNPWLTPTGLVQPRFARFQMQFDF